MSFDVIKFPLSTEKSIRKMESDNTLVFIVDKKSTKPQIKSAIEELYGAKVVSVKVTITQDSKKKAYVKFSDETPAIDIATKMGLM
jgi:ribosomal protein uL23